MTWRWLLRIRTRLTAWYVGVLAGVLLMFLAGTSWVMFTELRGELARYAVQDLTTIEGLVAVDGAGRLHVREDDHNHPDSRLVLERFVEIRAADGSVLYANGRLGISHLPWPAKPGAGEPDGADRSARLADGTRLLFVDRRASVAGRPISMRVAYSLEPVWRRVHNWIIDTLWSLSIALIVAALAGYRLAGMALGPFDRMAHRVEEITAERLHDRLPVGTEHDEPTHLARVFNQLLDRVEWSFARRKRLTADASQELRTPLAAIRTIGEVALQHHASAAQYRAVIASMLEEVNRSTSLVDGLLATARSDPHDVDIPRNVQAAQRDEACRPSASIVSGRPRSPRAT